MARKTLEQIDASLARWQTRLKRAVNAIEKLNKQRKRIAKAQADLAVAPPTATRPRPRAHAEIANPSTLGAAIQEAIVDQGVAAKPDDLAIPTFLQRKKLDPVAAQIVEEQANTKKRKAAGRIAKMKAKQSGEMRRMPLTGKAALAAIERGAKSA